MFLINLNSTKFNDIKMTTWSYLNFNLTTNFQKHFNATQANNIILIINRENILFYEIISQSTDCCDVDEI